MSRSSSPSVSSSTLPTRRVVLPGSQSTLETWEMKAKRLALEVKAARPTNEAPTRKQRETYRRARYALALHLEAVVE